jgi:hypothetical protein
MRVINKLIIAWVTVFAITAVAQTSSASPALGPQPWGLFGFDGVGTPAVTCLPTDCTQISADAFYLGDAPWTFTGFGFLIVQDAFNIGDQFRVFDNGSEIGITSAPVGIGSCGIDPDDCFVNNDVSKGIFTLDDGAHSFTMTQIAGSPGAGYLCVSTTREGCSPVTAPEQVPEPTTMVLLGFGLVGAFWWLKRPQLREVKVLITRYRPRRK